MDFNSYVDAVRADPQCSKIIINQDLDKNPSLGAIVSLIEERWGKVVMVRVIDSSEHNKKIIEIDLVNQNVNEIVLALIEELFCEVEGISSSPWSSRDKER